MPSILIAPGERQRRGSRSFASEKVLFACSEGCSLPALYKRAVLQHQKVSRGDAYLRKQQVVNQSISSKPRAGSQTVVSVKRKQLVPKMPSRAKGLRVVQAQNSAHHEVKGRVHVMELCGVGAHMLVMSLHFWYLFSLLVPRAPQSCQ
jgi:hypothetical protein